MIEDPILYDLCVMLASVAITGVPLQRKPFALQRLCNGVLYLTDLNFVKMESGTRQLKSNLYSANVSLFINVEETLEM